MERRDTTSAVARPRLKRVEKGGRRLVGYAAIFYDGRRSSEYPLKPGTVERISRTAFDATLERGDDVLALFNHESGSLLGRVASGTMKLRARERGCQPD